LHVKLRVIYVVKDPTGAVTRTYKKEVFENGNLHETIVYYYVPPKKSALWEKYVSYRKYTQLYQQFIQETIQEFGKPGILHVYIALKAGIIARKISKKNKIPFVVSEQWTAYLPEAQPHFSDLPFYLRLACKKIMKDASSVMVVSNYLSKCLKRLFKIKQVILIPNVVDKSVFYLNGHSNSDNTERKENRFIHISTLGYQKNAEDIILALSVVKKKGYEIFLDVVGPHRQSLVQLVNQLRLNDVVVFHNEMPQQELAVLMKRANALILYSRYETFGCVLIEAYACGLPVIVSDIEVMHENVFDFTGVFAEKENFIALSEKIIFFIENKKLFDKNKIADFAIEKYNYERIGLQFYKWYQELLIDDIVSANDYEN